MTVDTPTATTALVAPTSMSSTLEVTLNPKTGEPRRPLVVWIASAFLYAGAATIIVALLATMWFSIIDFTSASWLGGAVPTPLGDPLRALLAVAMWICAVGIASVACVASYYAWCGYAWTRWAGLIACVLGATSALLIWFAPLCLIALVAGEALLWLPASRRFFDSWTAHRSPRTTVSAQPSSVVYGPAMRYLV